MDGTSAMKDVSIRDLADAAGVSIATVSRALSNKPGVSTTLRRKIINLVHEKGYTYEGAGSCKTIGIICGSLTMKIGRYTDLLLNSLYKELKECGYRVMLVSYEDVSLFNESLISGVISMDFFRKLSHEWPEIKNIPLVCVNDKAYHLEQVYSVKSDTKACLRLMIEEFLKHGHRKIGLLQYFNTPDENMGSYDKRDMFLELMKDYGLKNGAFTDFFPEDGLIHETVGRLLMHDITALAVIGESFIPPVRRSLDLYRKRIPEDISLICNEDHYSAPHFTPRQTTVSHDFPALAHEAVKMLEKLMNGDDVADDVIVDYIFNRRESVGPLSKR